MPFSDIVGHKKQLESLRWALEKNRLHHAYLFLGPEGVGKKSVALSMAMALHCLEGDKDFCGACSNCVRIQSGNHPDVRLVGPQTGKKEISIQQVRELERDLSFRAFAGRKKIAIVDPASLMNFPAQNALLKTLEEPPGDSLLILVSSNVGGLLPTVVSRCLRLAFAPLPLEEAVRFLVSRKGLEEKEAEFLAAMSMGSLGKALSADMKELAKRRDPWVQKLGSLIQGDCRSWIALAEELATDREDSLRFLEWIQGWCRDMLMYCVTGSSLGICNVDMAQSVKEQAELCGLERVLLLLSEASKTGARIRRNFNRRMALENFLMKAVETGL